MPFDPVFDDAFHYAISAAVQNASLLCERIDRSAFVGGIVERIKEKIRTATVLVADLSGANPNVYLEVGYAWGTGIPTVLIAKDSSELRFDVRGEKCIIYGNIKDLEEKLTAELKALFG